MPQPTRLDVAHRTARARLDDIITAGRQREPARSFCNSLLDWVFGKQAERPDESTHAARRLKFAYNSVVDAVTVGLDHTYGDSRQQEIEPLIFERLEELQK